MLLTLCLSMHFEMSLKYLPIFAQTRQIIIINPHTYTLLCSFRAFKESLFHRRKLSSTRIVVPPGKGIITFCSSTILNFVNYLLHVSGVIIMHIGVISSEYELLPYDYFDPTSSVQTFFLYNIKIPPTLSSLCIHKICTHYSVSPTRSVLGRILASFSLPPVILSLICDYNNVLITYFINYEELIEPCNHCPMMAIELHAS